jgi:hypothetical protein
LEWVFNPLNWKPRVMKPTLGLIYNVSMLVGSEVSRISNLWTKVSLHIYRTSSTLVSKMLNKSAYEVRTDPTTCYILSRHFISNKNQKELTSAIPSFIILFLMLVLFRSKCLVNKRDVEIVCNRISLGGLWKNLSKRTSIRGPAISG